MKPATWIEQHALPLSLPTIAPAVVARAILLLTLGLLILTGLWQLRTPDVRPASAPASEFSAARALEDLRVIAAESRAVGEPGNLAAREYLVEQIRALGLEPEIQTAPAQVRFEGADAFSAGTVNNVLVRIPGSDNTGGRVFRTLGETFENGELDRSESAQVTATLVDDLRISIAD